MSHDVSFQIDDKIVLLPEDHNLKGGICVLGGSLLAEFNVTYNYGWFYHRLIKINGETGLKALIGKTAKEVPGILNPVIEDLGLTPHSDYWAPTPGNAGIALQALVSIAEMCPPEAVFCVD